MKPDTPEHRAGRRWLGVLLAGVATVFACLVVATPAWAHAELVLASPGDGQVFQDSPEQLLLQFTEPVTVPADGIRLFGPDGERVATGTPVHRPNDATSVEASLPAPLSQGVHTLAWRVVSADSHPIQGAYTFTVGVAALGGTAVTPPVSDDGTVHIAYGAARWLGFAGLALLVGSAFFLGWCWPAGARRRAARILVWTGWGVSAGAALATIVLFGPYAAGAGLDRALDPSLFATTMEARTGRSLAVRIGLLLLVAPALAWLIRRYQTTEPEPRRRAAVAGTVLGVGAALATTWTLASHSVAGDAVAVAIPSDVVHLLAMSVWLGGLAMLGLVLLPLRDLKGMRMAVPEFSRAAVACVVALVVTGLFHSWRQVRTPGALLETPYGRMLLAKLSIVCLLLALGAGARTWVRRHYAGTGPGGRPRQPAGGPDPHQVYYFRRRIVAETMLGIAVLGASAVLVAMEPARTVHAAQQAPQRPPTAASTEVPGTVSFDAGSGPGRNGRLAYDIQPARVGQATVHLSVLDPTGRPMAVPEVRATMSLAERDLGPLPVGLLNAGPGHYLSTISIPMAGRWVVAVTIRTSEVDQAVVTIPVNIAAH